MRRVQVMKMRSFEIGMRRFQVGVEKGSGWE